MVETGSEASLDERKSRLRGGRGTLSAKGKSIYWPFLEYMSWNGVELLIYCFQELLELQWFLSYF